MRYEERYVKRRKIISFIALSLSTAAAILGLFWLGFILFDVLRHGISGLNLILSFLQKILLLQVFQVGA